MTSLRLLDLSCEVYGAVQLGRRGIGIELRPSYFRQAVRNLEHAEVAAETEQPELIDLFATAEATA